MADNYIFPTTFPIIVNQVVVFLVKACDKDFLTQLDNHDKLIANYIFPATLDFSIILNNRIRNISNLDSLTKLDVLDLHGNKVGVMLVMHVCNGNCGDFYHGT